MSATDDPRLKRFLGGFSSADDMQEPPGPHGDPQLAALTQFFQTLVGALTADDVIVDVGSGRGILAHILLRIWPEGEARPWYYAVDQEETLDMLSLPSEIHNHSRKISFADFVGERLPCPPQQVKVVVLRNIVHELNIRTTAEVLVALHKIVRAGGQVYLQDIVLLPKGERENAGWPVPLLRMVLERMGFDCGSPADLRSRSGTEWFTMILKQKAGHPAPSVPHATRLVADGREKQRQLRTARLAELSDSSEETLTEYIMLATEVGALTTQLQQTHYAATAEVSEPRVVAELPLVPMPASPLDYAEEMPSQVRVRSGLGGILSSKNLIDLPALLRRAVGRLWFAGYSQRLLFTIPEVRAELLDAATRGVDIRILLVDPDSPAARARSVSEAYAKPDDFFADVMETRKGFASFEEDVRAAVGADSAEIPCELRLCTSMLSSSFFFVDDLCICSLYSANLTGGAGAALVFKSSSVQPNGYFQVLLREFQSSWGQCER
jgi:SAM-dependent methyltransferase